MVVQNVDIDLIVDHYCLIFLFIVLMQMSKTNKQKNKKQKTN